MNYLLMMKIEFDWYTLIICGFWLFLFFCGEKGMSSIVKDMLIRSTTSDVHIRNLIKEKFGDRIDQFRARPRPSRWSGGARATRCHGSRIEPSGFVKSEPGSRLRARALLTPVSDPTPTTKKVRYAYLFFSPYVCIRIRIHACTINRLWLLPSRIHYYNYNIFLLHLWVIHFFVWI